MNANVETDTQQAYPVTVENIHNYEQLARIWPVSAKRDPPDLNGALERHDVRDSCFTGPLQKRGSSGLDSSLSCTGLSWVVKGRARVGSRPPGGVGWHIPLFGRATF
jgi:hypothetical protein